MSSTNNNNAATAGTSPVIPEYRKQAVKLLNTQQAESKIGLTLFVPQPDPNGHARTYLDYPWTDAQRDRFLADGTLPFDLNNVPSYLEPCPFGLWIFDGRGSILTDPMPEIEVDFLPDLERNKAIVTVDFGIPDVLCTIPPGLCRLIPSGPGKARLQLTIGNLS